MPGPNFTIPDNPVYNENIPSLADTDPASATNTFNPLFLRIITNVAALKRSSGKKYATITIGHSGSGHTANDVDYLCTGTNDHTVINNAIAALPSGGGKIVILNGTYNLSGAVTNSKNGVAIEGMGAGTVLKRMYNTTVASSGLLVNTGDDFSLCHLFLDGNMTAYNNPYNNCFAGNGSSRMNISHNKIFSFAGDGLYLTNYANDNVIFGNIFSCYKTAINLNINVNYNKIMNNEFYDSGIVINGSFDNLINNNGYSFYDDGNYAVYINNGEYNAVVGNHMYVVGQSYGVYIDGNSTNNALTGNTFNCSADSDISIYIKNGSRNSIVGNNIRNNCSITISVEGDYNLLSSNYLYQNDYYDDGTGNTFVNNVYRN